MSAADARLDAAIALARRLVQEPRVAGSEIQVSTSWSDGAPTCVHGDLNIHARAGTPAAEWVGTLGEALPHSRTSYPCQGRQMHSWRVEVDGVVVRIYLSSPLTQEAALG